MTEIDRRASGSSGAPAHGTEANLLHRAPVLLWQSEGGLSRTAFNPRWLDFTGRSLGQEHGEGWLAGLHPDDADSLRAEVAAAGYESRAYEHEYRLLHADGGYRWMLEQAEPVGSTATGEPVYSGCCVDITGRRLAEEARRLREEALERVGPATIATGVDGRIVTWNRRAEEVYGWTAEEVVGRDLDTIVELPAMDAEEAGEALARVRAGEVWSGETVVRRPDGTAFLARASVGPLLAADGSVAGAVAVSEDVTAWYSERGPVSRFGRLLDRSPNEIYICNAASLRFTRVNQGALHNLGYSAEEMQDLTPLDLKRSYTAETYEALIEPLRLGNSEQVSFQTEHTRKDGTVYPVEVRLSLSRDEVPPVLVAIVDDITERRSLEADLDAATLAKDRTMQELAEGRKELNDLIQNIPGVVWEARGELGTDGYHLTFVSNQIEEILGYTAEEVLGASGDPIFSVIHPDDREIAYAAAARVYEDSRPNTVRFRWITAEGRPMWIQSYFCAIEDGDDVVGLRGVNLVVNEQHRGEELLNFVIEAGRILASSIDYESTLRTMAQLAVPAIADWCAVHLLEEDGELRPVSVAHANPERVAWVAEMEAKFSGLSRPSTPTAAEMVVRTGRSQLVPEVTREMIEQAIPHHEARAAVEQLGMRSYMCVPMELRGNNLGAITFVAAESGHRFNESDLRAAEHLARRAASAVHTARLYSDAERERARFTTIVSWLDHALCQIDSRGRIEHTNPAAEALLGAPASDLLGEVLHDIVHGSVEDGEPCTREDCFLTSVLVRLETCRGNEVFMAADGSQVAVRVNCTPVVVAGQALGAIVAFEDITDSLEADQRKDNFLAFAAHELRNPLTPILGLSRWLDRQVRQSSEGTFSKDFADVAATLSTESERMANIVEVFLDLSRIESNRLVLEPAPCDLCDLIRRASEKLQSRNSQATVEVALTAQRFEVISDEARLSQVLANLLENAVKYGGEQPHITVTVAEVGGMAQIGVRDSGEGIPEEEQPRIFERFYRSPSAGSKKGFGVGLFLAREIVTQLGGTLSFVSQPGEGTEFFIELPRRMPIEE